MSRPLRIACLHSAAVNEPVFAEAAAPLSLAHGIEVVHDCGAVPLLIAAEQAGGLTDEIAARTAALLDGLAAHSDAVLLTCSTLGPGAEIAARRSGVPVLRVDAALAAAAVAAGQHILVLYTVETTLEPTRRVFAAAAVGRDVSIVCRMVEGAWQRFRSGDIAGYHRAVADAADAAMASADAPDVIALAQASMSGAAALTRVARPLTSPVAGLAAALQALTRR